MVFQACTAAYSPSGHPLTPGWPPGLSAAYSSQLQLLPQAYLQAKEGSVRDSLPLGLTEQWQNFWENGILSSEIVSMYNYIMRIIWGSLFA